MWLKNYLVEVFNNRSNRELLSKLWNLKMFLSINLDLVLNFNINMDDYKNDLTNETGFARLVKSALFEF